MPETTTAVAAPEKHSLQIPATVKELIEALIFAAEEPLTLEQIRKIYQDSTVEERRDLKENEIEAIISVFNDEFQQTNKPYRIIRIAGGYQFATGTEYAEWVGQLYKEQGRRKLSQSSLETLSIIAYRQPIIRPDIEVIRGVDCDYVLGTLLEKKLITIVGRAPTPGRPLLYGTTEQFLKHFGLNNITDLPKPREIEELLADSRYETERRMLEAEEQAEKEKKEEPDFKSRLPHIPKKKAELDDPAAIVPKQQATRLHVRKESEEAQTGVQQGEIKVLDPTHDQSPVLLPTPVSDAAASTPQSENVEQTQPMVSEETTMDQPLDLVPIPIASEPIEVVEDTPETIISVIESTTETTTVEQPEAIESEGEADQIEPEEITVLEKEAEDSITTELKLMEGKSSSSIEESTIDAVEQQTIPERSALEADIVQVNREEIEHIPDGEADETRQKIETASAERREELPSTEIETIPTESSISSNEVVSEQLPDVIVPPVVEVARLPEVVTPPFIAPIVDEVREPEQPTSRWQHIKDKIQGFIKKVFG